MIKNKFGIILFFSILYLASCQPSSPTLPPPSVEKSPARIDTLSIYSTSMDKDIPAIVMLPAGYDESVSDTYPVLYMLHGATGSYSSWEEIYPELPAYADEYELIIVCPDGGYTSWYWDSPIDPAFQYETHITREAIPFIDSTYRTRAEAGQRAISGLSMGGHGALYLAARHPDLFGAAGSMSGGVDIRPFPNNWDIEERLGSYEAFPERWDAYTVVNLDTALAKNDQALIIDCGVDDFFYAVNEDLHERLLKLEVEHDYIVRPGAHTVPYWENAIEYQLLFFSKVFFDTDLD
jgi:S-formylglutathione hydrolase FrmB